MSAIKEFLSMRLQADIRRIWMFYYDGFRAMTIGKSLWVLMLVKLFILFFVLKLFFFPDVLKTNYDNDADRAEAVRHSLIEKTK